MSETVPPVPPAEEGEGGEKFFDPVTGEPISKNAYKKLMKGGPAKKEKKEKPEPKPEGEKKVKEKKTKEPEQIFEDDTPPGEMKRIDGVFTPAYQPKYVESVKSYKESGDVGELPTEVLYFCRLNY